ncbi:MAG: ABC transporter transmembrane domain-containing protein, partial [Pseudomonadales bacterium]
MKSSARRSFGQHPIKSYKEIEFLALFKTLWPYLLIHKTRVVIAMLCLVGAIAVSTALPWALKWLVDDLDSNVGKALVIPLGFVLLYGGMRFASVFLGELRDSVFSRVTESAMRKVGLEVFNHLHKLELDFHLSRQTGGISRDIDRGTNGINFMMRFMVFNILPTIVQLAIIIVILLLAFNIWFSLITFICVVSYIVFSVITTEWRTGFVKEANRLDSQSNTRAIDSLLNY